MSPAREGGASSPAVENSNRAAPRHIPHARNAVEKNGVSAVPAEPHTSSAPSAPEPQQQPGYEYSLPEDARRIGGSLTLLDGRTVYMRAIQPDDSRRLRAFHARLSPQTIYLRYFCAMPSLPEAEALRFAHVDYERRMAVVATTVSEGEEQIIAVVGYEPTVPATAEVAFVVEDGWQGLGIGTHLLYVLAAYARRHGIVTLVAYVMPRNVRMLSVLHHSGFPYAQNGDDNVEVHLDISAQPIPN